MSLRPVALVALLALLLVACSDVKPVAEPAGRTSTSVAGEASVTSETTGRSTTSASGKTSSTTTVPSGGLVMEGPTGAGRASVTLVEERSEVCYQLTVRGIGAPSAAHVHRLDGEVVLGLQTPTEDGTVDTCAATDALLIEELAQHPGNFYVDVHGELGDLRATLR